MIDYQTFLMPLPGKVNEAVVANEDGSYTIFIEETLSPEHRKKTFLHALKHLTGKNKRSEVVETLLLLFFQLSRTAMKK